MTTQNPAPSEPTPEEERLLYRLQRAYDTEAPRREFLDQLSEQLDLEFDQLLQCDSPAADSQVDLPAVVGPAEGTPVSGQWRLRRSFLAVVASLAVLMFAVLWPASPSYSWARMLKAMEQQPWVETQAEGGTAPPSRGWMSRRHRLIVNRQGNSNVVWKDLHHRMQSCYEATSDVLTLADLNEQLPSVEQTLLLFLMGETGCGSADRSGALFGDVRVESETWQTVESFDRPTVKLSVVLQLAEAATAPVRLALHLDPDTHLPRQAELHDLKAETAGMVRFVYPQRGPQEVYDVGVPRTASVVDLRTAPIQLGAVEVALAEDPASPAPGGVARLPAAEPDPRFEAPEKEPADVSSAPASVEIEVVPHDPHRGMVVDVTGGGGSLDLLTPPPVIDATAHEMGTRIDELMAQLWQQSDVSPVEISSDAEFARRVYLDLTGRIPHVSESREFLDDSREDRRTRLIDQLLSRRDHATHLAAVWRRFLIPEETPQQLLLTGMEEIDIAGGLEEWLTGQFQQNVPYDEVVEDLLLAQGRAGDTGPVLFYTAWKLEPDKLAARTSRAFLGMRLECAQCHDHFFDRRLKQTDFWGLAAFFAQISRPDGRMDAVSPVLEVTDLRQGEVTLPETEDVIAPRLPLTRENPVPDESVTRREQLVAWMTAEENPHFARATVNRVWAHLFGRGLVHPIDDLRPDNPPLSPEVLNELAGFFTGTGYDLRELFRAIVSSQTYQRTSRSLQDHPQQAELFARMNIKSLTAEQLYDSIAVATRVNDVRRNDGSLLRLSNMGRQAFLEQFRTPGDQVTEFQAGIPQALTLMNGYLVQSATDLSSSGVLRSLQAPFFSDEQRLETLFLATLSRQPDAAEREQLLAYLTEPGGDRYQRLGDILWVLLNSAEFSLNH